MDPTANYEFLVKLTDKQLAKYSPDTIAELIGHCEIVRCEDCIFREDENTLECANLSITVPSRSFFCAEGHRKPESCDEQLINEAVPQWKDLPY